MNIRAMKDRRFLEIMLVVLVGATAALGYRMGAHKVVILNLFYLPIVLSGYYLGRQAAGVLAVFSVLAMTIVTAMDSTGFAAHTSPVMVGLVLTVWAGALGLTAILIGTLCDERASTLQELHEAYVGVVEVVTKYLQGSDVRAKTQSTRIAELSQQVAEQMGLTPKQVDDIRVGVLLRDLGDVEVTTKLLGRALGALETKPATGRKYTFLGTELVHSLGSVLTDAAPLILSQEDTVQDCLAGVDDGKSSDIPVGSRIIRAVRAYDTLASSESTQLSPAEILRKLRQDTLTRHDPEVLDALQQVVSRPASVAQRELVHA
jgi:hypothetical protein